MFGSLVQATEQVDSMVKKHINIFLVQSWTKIFACTGLRIGTWLVVWNMFDFSIFFHILGIIISIDFRIVQRG